MKNPVVEDECKLEVEIHGSDSRKSGEGHRQGQITS